MAGPASWRHFEGRANASIQNNSGLSQGPGRSLRDTLSLPDTAQFWNGDA
jgi:hypothetical protein